MSGESAHVEAAALGTTRYVQDGDIALLTIDNPPANALSFQTRNEMLKGLYRACGDRSVRAIVIIGSERAFCSGADIRQFDTPSYSAHPRTWHLAQAIEAANKPVLAAISGFAMGGGLELALAAHARIAMTGTVLGLPEVKLGVIPAAGGLLRLPRLIGVSRAYALIVDGATFTADEAQSWGLIDAVCASALIDHAKEFARSMIEQPIRRTLSLPLKRDTLSPNQHPRDPARAAVVACFDALMSKPTEATDEIIQRFSDELVSSDRARALRHLFAAKRQVARIPAVAPIPPEAIVIDGPDSGIAASLKQAGFQVRSKSVPRQDESLFQRFIATSPAGAPTELYIVPPDRQCGVFEIVQTPGALPEIIKALVLAAKRLHFVPVLTSREPIAPRLNHALRVAMVELIEHGVDTDLIRKALVQAGFKVEVLQLHLQVPASQSNQHRGPRRRAVTQEIINCFIAALAREGARIVSEGIGTDAAVDIVSVYGLGFAEDRGGPMYATRSQKPKELVSQASRVSCTR